MILDQRLPSPHSQRGMRRIASRSLSSGTHSRDPLARCWHVLDITDIERISARVLQAVVPGQHLLDAR